MTYTYNYGDLSPPCGSATASFVNGLLLSNALALQKPKVKLTLSLIN
jgi:hypothetical protein